MCLNGNFDTFCFDFANVAEVAVRKYFSPSVRGRVLGVHGHAAQPGPAERDWGCREKRSQRQLSPRFPGRNYFITGPSGSQDPSSLPGSQ